MKVNALLIHFKRCLKFTLFGSLLVLFNFTALLAQDVTVSGTVISSEDNSSIPGVNVLIKGSSTGTTTDLDGKYSLSVPGSESFLIFSSVGYTTVEIQVGNQSVIDMSLVPDITQLSEIVVTAFGTAYSTAELTAISDWIDS